MSESAGLTLISAQVQASTGFSSANVDIGDWKLLNKGTSDHYAIIRPGPTTRTALTLSVKDTQYRTIVEVWQRYKDDGATMTNLLGHVDNITTRIDAYRKLADTTKTLRDANITGYGEVMEKWTRDGGVMWLERDIYIDWMEEEAVTYAE
jgi:hypothetical protein